MAILNRSETHRTADGHAIKIGDILCFRIGSEYPEPGRWRIRRMRVVEFVGKRNVRLEVIAKAKSRYSTRDASVLYRQPDNARGL